MHEHMSRVVGVELGRRSITNPRVLDVGCGDGRMLDMLCRADPGAECHGVEVDDSAVQVPTFYARTLENLSAVHPETDWTSRLHVASTGQPWPFEDSSFDVVVSNQVCEHVKDLGFLLAECSRVLRPGGFAVHVFPLQAHTIEVHTGMPFGHRILNGDLRRLYYGWAAQLGLSRLGPLRRSPGESPADFARSRSDFVTHETASHRWPDIAAAAAAAGMTPSYRHTVGVYLLKVLGPSHPVTTWYYRRSHPLVDAVLFRFLARIASVTIFLEKSSQFDPEINAQWAI